MTLAMKRISVFITMVLVFLSLHAQEIFDEGIFTYAKGEKDTLYIVSFSQSFKNDADTSWIDIHIPSTITYQGGLCPVKSIGGHLWDRNTRVRRIIIDEGIKSIKDGAFQNFYGLESIFIPSTVDSIGDGILAYCTKLNTIEVDQQNPWYSSYDGCNCIVKHSLHTDLIAGCNTTIIPKGVERIYKAFQGCDGIEEIDIPEGVKDILRHSFVDCTALRSICIPSTLGFIDVNAFEGCCSLEDFHAVADNKEFQTPNDCCVLSFDEDELILGGHRTVIPSSVRVIRQSAFKDRFKLQSIDIPEGVEEIYDSAFWGCKNLSDVRLPQSLKILDGGVFGKCESLREIIIPKGVNNISGFLFWGCGNLNKIIIDR